MRSTCRSARRVCHGSASNNTNSSHTGAKSGSSSSTSAAAKACIASAGKLQDVDISRQILQRSPRFQCSYASAPNAKPAAPVMAMKAGLVGKNFERRVQDRRCTPQFGRPHQHRMATPLGAQPWGKGRVYILRLRLGVRLGLGRRRAQRGPRRRQLLHVRGDTPKHGEGPHRTA